MYNILESLTTITRGSCMGIIDVTVFLNSTRNLMTGQESLRERDLPLCCTIMKFDKPMKKINKMRLERICHGMARVVYINPAKKYFFIGENPENSETALVEYNIQKSNQYGDLFIERWETMKKLFFELNVYAKKMEYLFTLTGLWDGLEKRWTSLTTSKNRTIVTTKQDNTETIISKG